MSSHVEIDSRAFMSLEMHEPPFQHMNQGPRQLFEAGMYKQAIEPGDPVTMARHTHKRFSLSTAQTPLIHGPAMAAPSGINCIVAFYPHSENVEDAFVINRAFVERGGLAASVFIPTVACRGDDNCVFEKPDAHDTDDYKAGSYSKIRGDTGMPDIGEEIEYGDVIIGRTAAPFPGGHSTKKRDRSVTARYSGIVDDVVASDRDPFTHRVTLRTQRDLCVGDKCSSRHGQKGTIGAVLNQEDMPFSEMTGMVPDMLISPESLVSRMTIGEVLEVLLGKAVAVGGIKPGCVHDEHTGTVTERLISVLRSNGFSACGGETMRCGKSGREIECKIMMGVCYMQRLVHIAQDKMHVRSTGPYATLTRQPTTGKAHDGGQRIAAMEVNVFISYGVTSALSERHLKTSDEFDTWICSGCGWQGIQNKICTVCGCDAYMKKMSASTLLMMDEMAGLGIKTAMLKV
jgi:DNA-directed RNA polymerase beta subunit